MQQICATPLRLTEFIIRAHEAQQVFSSEGAAKRLNRRLYSLCVYLLIYSKQLLN